MKDIYEKDKYYFTIKFIFVMSIVFAIAGVIGPLLLKQYNLSILSVYLIIPMLAAPILWLKLKTKEHDAFRISKNFNDFFILVFFLCYLISVLILYHYPVRTIPYYILIAVMGVFIFMQIVCFNEISNKQSMIVLVQVILLLLNIVWGVTLKYYLFIGRTDIFFHSWAIENLLRTGHINQTFDIYQAFPLWHILCSFVYQIMNLSSIPSRVMFITNGLIYCCLVIIIYLAASKLFNRKIALLSALFMCFNTDVIFYGMYSIPRSVVLFLEGLLIFLLTQKKTRLNTVLCILIMIGLIMYHTASMPFIILILGLFYILQTVYRVDKSKRFVSFNFILLIIISTITYWMYAGIKVFNSFFGNLLQEPPTGVLTKSIVETPLQELFNYLQYSPLLLFLILGVLWGLSYTSRLKDTAKITLMISLLLVPVSFPGPALLLNKLAGNLNLERFGEYSFLFFCFAGAAGFIFLFYKLKAKFIAVTLFFVMAFLAVSNDFTASDNPLIKRPFYTFYFSEEECISLERAAQIADGYVMSDYNSCRYLESSEYADKIHVLEVNQQYQEFLRSSGNDMILIKNGELTNRPLKLFTSPNGEFLFNPSVGDKLDYYTNDLPLWHQLERYKRIYDSGDVQGFQ